jgi:signal transduction histidine kinase
MTARIGRLRAVGWGSRTAGHYVGRVVASRPLRWVRGHPVGADIALAGVLAAAAMPRPFVAGGGSRSGDVLAVALVLAESVPLVWRRSRPDVVLVAVGAATVAYYAAGYGSQPAWAALVVAFYSFGAHRRGWADLWAVGAVGLEAAASFGVHLHRPAALGVAGVSLGACVAFVVAWTAGEVLRTRRAETSRLSQRAERAEAEREARAREAVAAERARIARELHDVVAHALGVIVMQAGGAARVANLDRSLAQDIFASIEQSGRQAFAEMRRLLDVLRDDQPPALLTPQPTLADLDGLVAGFSDAGLTVSVKVEGEPVEVGAGIELSVYRIVQEALTNTLKHAGPVPVRVELSWKPPDLHVDVTNGTPLIGGPAIVPDSGGHGLIGMRERVSLLRGELRVGPTTDGEFCVHARIPIPTGVDQTTGAPLVAP